tara:strand:+ start:9224 stop:9700 length:477 start_codon:yes stop_codon:yes gene_type:complete
MKKYLLIFISLLTINACEITPIEGCTDNNALNHNISANIDDNSCDYKSEIIFFLEQSAGIYLYNQGVQELMFYIDSNYIGSQYNNDGFITSQVIPNCGDTYYTNYTVYWTGSSYNSFYYEVTDENGYIWYNTSLQTEANECKTIGLTANNIISFQNEN